MRIPNIEELKQIYKNRHTTRGYYDLMKILFGMAVCLLIIWAFSAGRIERFESATFDYRMKLHHGSGNDKIVFVDMGEDSIEAIGRWPWPREWHATMISILSSHGAEAVIFDVIFAEHSGEFSDSAMEEAMKAAGNVYIPYAVELDEFDKETGRWGIRNTIRPIERFSMWAKGLGHITIVPDIDGTIRRVPIVIAEGDNVYPQLGLRVASNVMGFDPEKYETNGSLLGRHIEIGRESGQVIRIPVNAKNQMLVNWAAEWGKGFKHYSFIDVITSFQKISAGEEPLIDLDVFKGKICIIGLTAAGLYDIKPNPMQPTYPAVGTNANVISNLLNNDFIMRVPLWVDGLIILIMGMMTSIYVARVQPVRGALVTAAVAALYILVSYFALDILGIWLSVIFPILTVIFCYLAIAFYNQIIISLERAKLFTLATKDGLTGLYVVRHFNLLLEAEMERVKTRGGKLSVLMSDIDHFKKINDSYGHQVGDVILREIAEILMACCRQLDIPSRYGGEEFIAMLPGANITEAVGAAERLRERVENANFKFGDKIYKATISVGVAVYNGEEQKDDLIRKADAALYEAKDAGRNRVCVSKT